MTETMRRQTEGKVYKIIKHKREMFMLRYVVWFVACGPFPLAQSFADQVARKQARGAARIRPPRDITQRAHTAQRFTATADIHISAMSSVSTSDLSLSGSADDRQPATTASTPCFLAMMPQEVMEIIAADLPFECILNMTTTR